MLKRRHHKKSKERFTKKKFHLKIKPATAYSIAQIFFARNATTAQKIAQALRAESVSASVLYNPDVVDYHIYAHWTPILHQRTWTPEGGPWRWARRDYAYTKDMCPRTLDLLGRAIHLHVNPLLTDQDIEETLDGLNKVLNALA